MPITKVENSLEKAKGLEQKADSCIDPVEANMLLQDARNLLKKTPEALDWVENGSLFEVPESEPIQALLRVEEKITKRRKQALDAFGAPPKKKRIDF